MICLYYRRNYRHVLITVNDGYQSVCLGTWKAGGGGDYYKIEACIGDVLQQGFPNTMYKAQRGNCVSVYYMCQLRE
jgi:hypothetical protein